MKESAPPPAPPPAPPKQVVVTPRPAPEKPQQQASLQPPTTPITPSSSGVLMSVPFQAGSENLSDAGAGELGALATQLARAETRLQLKAYAGANGGSESAARRLSLSRALKVRSHLIRNGVASTRIDVRALGIAQDGSADRVDVLILQRK
jgi:outer membrane protein OmpA-like peptidoglycan-associated protein